MTSAAETDYFVPPHRHVLSTASNMSSDANNEIDDKCEQFAHIRSIPRRLRASAFFEAAVAGDSETVAKMLNEVGLQTLVNRTDIDLYTPLHRVIEVFDAAIHTKVANMLVAGGADVEASQPGLDGWTPLHFAAWKGNVQACQFLLAAGADRTKIDWYGKTALQWAVSGSYPDVVAVLKEPLRSAL